jgi:uncharacterized protein YecE (DUF72 family)
MHPINIGTCGWWYKDWSGPLYPEGLPAGAGLSPFHTVLRP